MKIGEEEEAKISEAPTIDKESLKEFLRGVLSGSAKPYNRLEILSAESGYRTPLGNATCYAQTICEIAEDWLII